MKSVARTMRKNGGGSIINASSIEGLAGMAGCTAYAATKFAIRGMTKCAAMELGPKGDPGQLGAPRHDRHPDDPRARRRRGDGVRRQQGRRCAGSATPSTSRRSYVFLASDECSYVTGAEIAIDGGVTATHAFGG